MKKFLTIIISLILICACALGVVGCGNESDPPKEYTVKFDLNGGSGSIDDRTVKEGEKLSEPTAPTREGYSFDGWFTEAEGGAMWSFSADTVTEPITLYAHWTVQAIENDKFSFRAIEEGGNTVSYAISGLGEVNLEQIVIPTQHNGLPVTRIDGYAFYECNSIVSVEIRGNITEIGDSAFYNCEKLERLVIDAKISKMGELAFAHCLALEEVQIGSVVEEISYYAFFECSALKEVTVPASVKSIGESAFSFCTSLEKVTLNEGLEYIGDCAFGGCFALEEFIMPNSVTEIGFGVLMFVGGYLFDGEEIYGNCSVKKVVMSDNITEITQFAFSGCMMPTVTIGKKVELIDYSSFYGCERLESVVIPVSVNRIVSYAFYRCYMLNTVFYEGTAEEWKSVKIAATGNDIVNAELYYYSESAPQQGGNYWHYAADGVTPEKW